MADLVRILERMYQGFFLRDILGFVAPGSISLMSLWLILDSKYPQITSTTVACLWGKLSVTWRVIVFLVAAYLLAWTLQSVHYGFLNLIGLRFFAGTFSELAPLVHSMNAEEMEERLKQSPIVTRGALEPDLVLAKSMPEKVLEDRLRDLPYTERVSALFLMTGNLTIATVLLVLMLICRMHDWRWIAGFLIPLFLYIEHWRLWKARNLQIAIYAVYAMQLKERKDAGSIQPKGGAEVGTDPGATNLTDHSGH